MSDPRLAQLLDRAVHDAPHMKVSAQDLLAAGRGRVRRRRAAGVGGALGATALLAALWGGLTGDAGSPLRTTDIQPATTVWEQGASVDGTLFTGFRTVGDDQVAHVYDARLSRPSDEGPVTLVLTDQGAVVEEIPARSPVTGLEVFAGERMTVAVWVEPAGVTASAPLVGPVDPGGPSDVRRAEVGSSTVAYSVWAADVVASPEAVRDVYLVGREEVVSLSGAQVRSAVLRAGGERAVAWSDGSRGVWGYAVGTHDPMVEQLGSRPAHASASYAVDEDGVETAMRVLPEEADVVDVALADGGSDSAVLDGRAVVMTTRTGADTPDVLFALGDRQYDLHSYLEDLGTLHPEGGTAWSVDAGTTVDPGISLVGQDGERVELARDGNGLLTGTVGGTAVVGAVGWAPGPTVLADGRVALSDGGSTRWTAPADVAQVQLDDGTLVTLMAVEAADGASVVAVGRRTGDRVERWTP